MNTSSTDNATAASPAPGMLDDIAVLPHECQPWCVEGDGHPNEIHPDDRRCVSRDWYVPLSLSAPVRMGNGNPDEDIWVRDHLQLHLARDTDDDGDRVALLHGSMPRGITLTRDELRRLVGAGLAMLDASEPQGS